MKEKRGKDAMDDIGIMTDFKGTAVHDCFASYWNYDCIHSLCNAHLLRELAFIDQRTGQRWAKEMILLLLEIKNVVDLRRIDKKGLLPKGELSKYIRRYNMLVEEGMNKDPEGGKR
jgi:transposase